MPNQPLKYDLRGVSADKSDVHEAIKNLANLAIRMHQEMSKNQGNHVSHVILMHLAKKAANKKAVARIATEIETEIETVTKVIARKVGRNHHKTIHRHDI